MLHADLRRCGIEPVDAQGRVADIHSLRSAYISALARSGASLKAIQTLARHSDPRLTMNVYAHLTAFDLHGAVAEALPDLTASPEPTFMAATGTDGPIADQIAASEDVDASKPYDHQVVASNDQRSSAERIAEDGPKDSARACIRPGTGSGYNPDSRFAKPGRLRRPIDPRQVVGARAFGSYHDRCV
jgi:hypothetical protein